jgi:hypothetical protein
VVRLLMQNKRVDPTHNVDDTISSALENRHLEVVKLLLTDSRVNLENSYVDHIVVASINGNIEQVQRLLRDGVNPSVDDNLAVIGASHFGHWRVVRLLLRDPRVFEVPLTKKEEYGVLQNTMLDYSSDPGKELMVLYMMYHGVLRRIPGNKTRIKVTKNYVQELVEELVETGPKQLPILMILSYRIENLPMLYFLYDKIHLQWGSGSDEINHDGTYNIYLNDLSEIGIKRLLGRMRDLCLEREIKPYVIQLQEERSNDDNKEQNTTRRRLK